jgi:electron transport complex protein RnfE
MPEEEEATPEEELIPEEIKEKFRKASDRFKRFWQVFGQGIIKQNPIFIMALGLCPTLAVTTSLDNAVTMGFAASFVLFGSAIFVSSIRKTVPPNVRIPVFIVIIATFVTIASLVLQAYFPPMYKALGIFVPLIVVNCIILGRAEGYSSKNSIKDSIFDALGMGLGFSLAIMLISSVREILGTGKLLLFGRKLLDITNMYNPMVMFILAPGALLTMGLLMAFFNWLGSINIRKQPAEVEAPKPEITKEEKISEQME